jgi:hypothetical protein
VERIRAGGAFLQTTGRKVTAESLKQITRDLEPGFAGLSFQVIRRNPRAYAVYREAADAFGAEPTPDRKVHKRRRRRVRASGRTPRSSYDPLLRLDKRNLVQRIRTLEHELDVVRRLRGALAYDEQALRAKLLRVETEAILLQAGGPERLDRSGWPYERASGVAASRSRTPGVVPDRSIAEHQTAACAAVGFDRPLRTASRAIGFPVDHPRAA